MKGILSMLPGRECNICGWRGLRFRPMTAPRYVRKDALCPSCGSHERHRALVHFFVKKENLRGKKVLEIAPVQKLASFFVGNGARYFSMDLFTNAAVKGDLRHAPFRDDSFDLILCYHVLEHIKEDHRALMELKRMLSQEGRLYVQVPMDLKLARTEEYETPDLYAHYHVRQYGTDFSKRLKDAGLFFKEYDFREFLTKGERRRYGCTKAVGLTYVCSKR